jgi:hypothetical protein
VTTLPDGEDRDAMKKNDGALAAELLAQEAVGLYKLHPLDP